jgi:hypothetical protein
MHREVVHITVVDLYHSLPKVHEGWPFSLETSASSPISWGCGESIGITRQYPAQPGRHNYSCLQCAREFNQHSIDFSYIIWRGQMHVAVVMIVNQEVQGLALLSLAFSVRDR